MKIDIDLSKLGDLLEQMEVPLQPFVAPEIEELITSTGLPVESDDVKVAPNGTLEYQGRKVVLYIRDVWGSLPKYHVVNCQTLKSMRSAGRYKRYVVTRRTDGEFILNFADNLSRANPETYRLDICKNCLQKELNLWHISPNAFPLTDWFNAIDPSYQPPPIDTIYGPKTTPVTGTISNYPPDWNLRSLQCREEAEWKCEECSIDLGFNRKFLHAHHLRGTQYNQPEDLKALCIGCHAEQPRHERMRSLSDYSGFMELYGHVWKQLTRK